MMYWASIFTTAMGKYINFLHSELDAGSNLKRIGELCNKSHNFTRFSNASDCLLLLDFLSSD